MLLNLTVTSLVLSQMSHSPAFAGSDTRYHLDRLQYLKQISPLVFGYRSLLVENSRMKHFIGSIFVAGGANGQCHADDCELGENDGTLRRCEISNGGTCSRAAPRYPAASPTSYIIDLSTTQTPVSFSVIECAFNAQVDTLILPGKTTTGLTVTGSCFAQCNPNNGQPLLVDTSGNVVANLNIDIGTTSVSQCTATKGVIFLDWGAAFTATLKFHQNNWTGNTAGEANALITYSDRTYSRTTTTTMTQCAFLHTVKAKCLIFAYDSPTSSTTVSNSFFLDTGLVDPAVGLFVIGEKAWAISECFFEDLAQQRSAKIFSFVENGEKSVSVTNCVASSSYIDFWVVTITPGKTVESSGNKVEPAGLIDLYPPFTMNEFMYKEYSMYCSFYTYPATASFTLSDTFTPTPYVPTPTGGGGGGGSGGPTASKPITVHIVFAVLTSAGTALVAFGVASLVFLCFRGCCIYDHQNYLKVDI